MVLKKEILENGWSTIEKEENFALPVNENSMMTQIEEEDETQSFFNPDVNRLLLKEKNYFTKH